jgi:hypothetical protein
MPCPCASAWRDAASSSGYMPRMHLALALLATPHTARTDAIITVSPWCTASPQAPAKPQPIHRKDYRPPSYLVDAVDLNFDLHEDVTTVTSTLSLRPNPAAAVPGSSTPLPLLLNGRDDVKLLELTLGGAGHITPAPAQRCCSAPAASASPPPPSPYPLGHLVLPPFSPCGRACRCDRGP